MYDYNSWYGDFEIDEIKYQKSSDHLDALNNRLKKNA